MPARLTRELLCEVARATVDTRTRIVFLCGTEAQADRLANRFRKVLDEEYSEHDWQPRDVKGRGYRSAGQNPSFVSLLSGAWVFFHPIGDLDAEDDIGQAQFVYWPTQGGHYEKVTYDFWKKERRKGIIYRPITTTEVKSPKKNGTKTAWDHILEMDDD